MADNNWINCDNRMPDDRDDKTFLSKLVQVSDGNEYSYAFWASITKAWLFRKGYKYIKNPTHWKEFTKLREHVFDDPR
jgi:hypothetical protein